MRPEVWLDGVLQVDLILRSRAQRGVSKDRPRVEGRNDAMLYLIEQCLNGIQLGMLLFLLAAGLTLIFGIMDLVNLAHGSLYMIGAYFAATFAALTGSFVLGAILALVATLLAGMALEVIAIRRSTAATTSIMCSAPSGCCCSSMSWSG